MPPCEFPDGKIGKERGKELVPAFHHVGKHGDGAGKDGCDDVGYPEDEVNDKTCEDRLLFLCKRCCIGYGSLIKFGGMAHSVISTLFVDPES